MNAATWNEIDQKLYKPEMVGGCPKSALKPWDARPECLHNFVTVIPRDDVFKKVVRSEISLARLGLHDDFEVEVDNTMTKDTGGVLEITAVGPGRVQNGVQYRPLVEAGDIVYANLFFVGHRIMLGRRAHYLFDMDNMLAKLDVETRTATPIGCNILTKPNDERMQAAMIGGLVGNTGKQIVLPGRATSAGLNSEEGRDPQKIVYEEVVAVGPGKWDGTIFVEPTVKVGQLVAFSKDSAATTVTIKGNSYTMVPWGHVQGIIPG